MVDFYARCLLDFGGLSNVEMGLFSYVRDLARRLGVLVS
jgi:hypothetical protein